MTPEFIVLILTMTYGFFIGLVLFKAESKAIEDLDEVPMLSILILLVNTPLLYLLLFEVSTVWTVINTVYTIAAIALVLYLPWHRSEPEESVGYLTLLSIRGVFLVFFPCIVAIVHQIAS